jgi:alanine racemase
VSYNQQWTASGLATTATVPFGYFEGLLRWLGGKLVFRWNEELFQQIGTICMNLCCCLGNKKMQIGDQVWIIEQEKNSPLSVHQLAKTAHTVPYEILVKLERSIRRVLE